MVGHIPSPIHYLFSPYTLFPFQLQINDMEPHLRSQFTILLKDKAHGWRPKGKKNLILAIGPNGLERYCGLGSIACTNWSLASCTEFSEHTHVSNRGVLLFNPNSNYSFSHYVSTEQKNSLQSK